MQFERTEEQNLIREMVRSFAETEVAPSAAERDEKELFDGISAFIVEKGMAGFSFGKKEKKWAFALHPLLKSTKVPVRYSAWS